MKQMKLRKYGMILLGLGISLVTSCSKEEVEKPVDYSEPVVPMTRQELTGVFEGQWSCDVLFSQIVVNDGYIFVDELPAEAIFSEIKQHVLGGCIKNPEMKAKITDSIGNIFFASSYQYPITDLQIQYELGSYSVVEGVYHATMSSIKNKLSDISTWISICGETPSTSETIVINAPEPNTISFDVIADGVPYRIDLVSKEHDVNIEFLVKQQWHDTQAGLWIIKYWFNAYRVINLETGKQYYWSPTYNGLLLQQGKEDTNLLQFESKKRTGSAEERVITYQ